MIRERRDEDLDRLCAVVAGLHLPAGVMSGQDAAAWLATADVEQAWVYDMAPVHVAPTRNVVGHVQIYRPTEASMTPGLAGCAEKPVDELLAIGRFLIAPQPQDYGIARHLLQEARRYIQRQGRTAVLDLQANSYLTRDFCEKYGFSALPSKDPAVLPMIHTG